MLSLQQVLGDVCELYALEKETRSLAKSDVVGLATGAGESTSITMFRKIKELGSNDIDLQIIKKISRIADGKEEDFGPFMRECDYFLLRHGTKYYVIETDKKEPKVMKIANAEGFGDENFIRTSDSSNVTTNDVIDSFKNFVSKLTLPPPGR
jgi:hypothetical protein